MATTRLPGRRDRIRRKDAAARVPSGVSGSGSVIASMAPRTKPGSRPEGMAAVSSPHPARRAPSATMRAAPPFPRDPDDQRVAVVSLVTVAPPHRQQGDELRL